MSGYVVTDIAEAQAIALCVLARQQGLPPIHALRSAVVQLHAGACGWCEWPVSELVALLERAEVSKRAEQEWWGMPGRSRLRAIELAQGAEA